MKEPKKILATLISVGTFLDAIGYNNDEIKENIRLSKEGLNKAFSLNVVVASYSIDQVREIALELTNAAMYGHSHKLTRFELQDKLSEIKNKHGLDYKKGVDNI
ncbi:hypothetical protein [Polaribacter sp. NJDZ03]|uniref:hypothetical protein n=1 Tax=Polaribacter sp. NJDZ03 TaxID=2855841 RepID=UPI001C49EBB7|nr:hypothetical protein [Polaribacter sp. NJDZ03]